ncbi:MAG: hypothetical protein WCH11_04055, partial [Bdellovibrio sp.]
RPPSISQLREYLRIRSKNRIRMASILRERLLQLENETRILSDDLSSNLQWIIDTESKLLGLDPTEIKSLVNTSQTPKSHQPEDSAIARVDLSIFDQVVALEMQSISLALRINEVFELGLNPSTPHAQKGTPQELRHRGILRTALQKLRMAKGKKTQSSPSAPQPVQLFSDLESAERDLQSLRNQATQVLQNIQSHPTPLPDAQELSESVNQTKNNLDTLLTSVQQTKLRLQRKIEPSRIENGQHLTDLTLKIQNNALEWTSPVKD